MATIYSVLANFDALIVHFSAEAKGEVVDPERIFPRDLVNVIAGKFWDIGLSCSTVRPGDRFGVPYANGVGYVGVVLGLKRQTSLTDVTPSDAGSSTASGKREVGRGTDTTIGDDITIFSVTASIEARQSADYNEWGVEEYAVLGVFVGPPCLVVQPNKSSSSSHPTITLDKVLSAFPDQPLYTFTDERIRLWNAVQHEFSDENHGSIYGVLGL